MKLIDLINEALFYREATQLSDSERRTQMETARERTKQFVLDVIPDPALKIMDEKKLLDGLDLLVDGLQHPRLNKQLSYLLLDSLVDELFPDIAERLNRPA